MAENPATEEAQAQQQEQEAEKQQLQEEESEQREQEEVEKEEEDDEERPVSSSMLASWGYDREGEEIYVEFLNGRTESYSASPQMWEDAKNAVSPGKWMYENVL